MPQQIVLPWPVPAGTSLLGPRHRTDDTQILVLPRGTRMHDCPSQAQSFPATPKATFTDAALLRLGACVEDDPDQRLVADLCVRFLNG